MKLTKRELFDIILNFIPEDTKKSGLGREHFEKTMLDSINVKCYSKAEKANYIKIMKVVLDKVFPC